MPDARPRPARPRTRPQGRTQSRPRGRAAAAGARAGASPRRRVLVVTGSRAEFGLLTPVMEAVRSRKGLELLVAAAGSHLLPPARTAREVEAAFGVDARVPMQKAGEARTRLNDARAVARGVDGFARAYARLKPDWVVVLGDRIEAFAAASAASVAGIAVCHIHGGDRAEGIADEAMRHAITKLSHLHCAATERSARRIVRMGERAEHVHVTGSPAIDGLDGIPAMSDGEVEAVGEMRRPGHWKLPATVLLLHPDGTVDGTDPRTTFRWMRGVRDSGWVRSPVLALAPNHDAGREAVEELRRWGFNQHHWRLVEHLPRARFVGLLKWMAARGVPLVGNSSAGLIECAALGVPVVNLGPRQAGRERAGNVLDVPMGPGGPPAVPSVRRPARGRRLSAVPGPAPRGITIVSPDARRAAMGRAAGPHEPGSLFGDGRAGPRIAALLAKVDPRDPDLLRKRNAY